MKETMHEEAIRQRILRAHREPPTLENYQRVLVLWRLPHLESCNHAWIFLSSKLNDSSCLRLVIWDCISDKGSEHLNQNIQNIDVNLSSEELIEAYIMFSELNVRGEQDVGIYDGPRYGRILFYEGSGEIELRDEWVQPDTFLNLSSLLSNRLKIKMKWSEIEALEQG